MVYGFVSELGGALAFDSSPGAGTTVSVFLRKADGVAVVETPDPADRFASGRAGRILVVDDDADVRLATRTMLEERGHEVIEAGGGAEALEVLDRDRRFDLLVIDFAMPSMNGSQLATEVRQRWLGAPILFVTGYVENDVLRPWSDLGYVTVQKPFSASDLGAAVERAMLHAEAIAI
jgi:CheY-like chemotaxis protein